MSAGGTSLETALYLPVKRHLESLGYAVKGEIGGCDLVGLSEGDPQVVVIGELKLTFTFELVLQGVDRAGVGDEVWLAARLSRSGKGRESDPRFRNLCRRLGFGLLGVAVAAKSMSCSARSRRARAAIPSADPGSSKSIGAGKATRWRAAARAGRS